MSTLGGRASSSRMRCSHSCIAAQNSSGGVSGFCLLEKPNIRASKVLINGRSPLPALSPRQPAGQDQGTGRDGHFSCALAPLPRQFFAEHFHTFFAHGPPLFAQVPTRQYPLVTPRWASAGGTDTVAVNIKARPASSDNASGNFIFIVASIGKPTRKSRSPRSLYLVNDVMSRHPCGKDDIDVIPVCRLRQ